MKKQIVSVLLLLCMVIGMLPAIATAAEKPEKVILNMKVGERKKVEVKAASYFSSTNQGIATVSQDGEIVAREPGTVNIYAYLNSAMVGFWQVKVVEDPTKVEEQPVNNGNYPFVPNEKYATNGHIKSGWKNFVAYNNCKFRITSEGKLVPSWNYSNPLYVEHLGASSYYIRTVDGKFLCYEGSKPYYDVNKQEGSDLAIRDKPYKWYVYPHNDGGIMKYSFATSENHELIISSFEPCGDPNFYFKLVQYKLSMSIGQKAMFQVLDADEKRIPEWWYKYKGEEVQTDKEGFDYYGRKGFESETSLPSITTRVNYNIEMPVFNREFPTWGTTIKTQLLSRTKSGSYVAAMVDDQYVTIKKFSAEGKEIGSKPIEIEKELPIFGAVYSGEKYNYIAFGQKNPTQDSNKESIRIVKYDKEFNRLSSASIKGWETLAVEPFCHTARFAEEGNQLVLHTSRLRFKSSDGLNHQSNLDIFLTPSTMKTTYVSSDFPKNHVSHSFDTYAQFDGSTPVFLDHGDASPRSVVLQKGSTSSYKKATMFEIAGPSGANYTGVTVGGLGISQNNYLTAIATINQSDAKWGEANSEAALNSALTPINEKNLSQRDIVVSVLPRDFGDGAKAQNITIAKYIGTSKLGSTPQLLKITDDKFAVLWTEFSLNKTTYAVDEDEEESEEVPESYVVQYIDGNGNTSGETKRYKKINEFYKDYLTEFKGQATESTDNNTQNSTTPIKNGWYNLRAMNNYLNITSAGNAELRKLTTNEEYYVENKDNNQVTLKMADGRYLGIADAIKNGTKVKAVSEPYLWKLYDEDSSDIFSLRPAVDTKMLLNASNEKNADGTPIILWTHDEFDAPKHAEFRFLAIDKSNAKHPFIDVKTGSYYEDAVVWALNNKVTSGTSDITFAPNDTCTRGQVVTFLWRSKGSPEPKSKNNPFTDVKSSDYYYKAVLWAVENDITSGTSTTTFSPNDTCISGQVIAFLYRANGSPNKTGKGQYYDDAVKWANEGGLLKGTDTAFAPNNKSPRADIVTYLYRNSKK